MSFEPKRPVTLEDLLRLKRTERPPAEFWDQFDRELRAKQLAALVEKRPWWRSLPHVFDGLRRYRRYHLPLGATAVLAVTFFALRDRPAALENISADATAGAAAPAAAALDRRDKTDVLAAVPVPVAVPEKPLLTENSATFSASSVALVKNETMTANLVSLSAPAPEGGVATELAPSARQIATNLMVAQMTDPNLGRGILAEPGLSDAAPTLARGSFEPLAQVASSSNGSRFARLRTAMASPIINTVVHTTERVTRELSDERLSEDGIRRFAAKGDRLSVKF